MFFSFTIGWEMFTRFSAHSTMEKVTGLRLSLPLSTLEMSRMSLISVSKWLLARLIFRRLSLTVTWSSVFFPAIVVSPMIAFMGVRISWDMVDRKSVLARFAWSAATAAAFSWRFRFITLCRLNMRSSSRPATIIPMSVQLLSCSFSSRIGIIVTMIQLSV